MMAELRMVRKVLDISVPKSGYSFTKLMSAVCVSTYTIWLLSLNTVPPVRVTLWLDSEIVGPEWRVM